jgi:hypothetical protein
VAASRLLVLLTLLVASCAAATAVSRGYEIHTSDLTCDDANRHVQQALGGMHMRITDFRKAEPGSPGYAEAVRAKDEGGSMKGTVDIRCDAGMVHVVPDSAGFSAGSEFERGFFLSMTGRADLVVEREGRYSTGVVHKRENTTASARATADSALDADAALESAQANDAGGDTPFAESAEGGVEVQVELVRGFATVLDFEANVSAAGILPVKITVGNKTKRSYDFDPRAVALRKDGTADRTEPMPARQAVERLQSHGAQAEGKAPEGEGEAANEGVAGGAEVDGLGDVQAASRIIPEREIKAVRLAPGQNVSGYLYFPDGEYDRARVTMTDVATGETEGFVVEF